MVTPNNSIIWLATLVCFSDRQMINVSGTHIDSPSHFFKGLKSITDIPVEDFVSPLVAVDVTTKVEQDNDYELTVDDLLQWEKKHNVQIPGTD
jgi:kynurenine formamidase